MEISRISQGGQTSFDISSTGENKVNVSNNVSSVAQSPTNSSNTNDRPFSEKDVKNAVERLNKFVESDNITVQYDVHPQFKDIMVKILDKTTGDVILEIPPKKILDVVAKMCELAGIIFDKKV